MDRNVFGVMVHYLADRQEMKKVLVVWNAITVTASLEFVCVEEVAPWWRRKGKPLKVEFSRNGSALCHLTRHLSNFGIGIQN